MSEAKPCVLWVGGSPPEMEAVRSAVGGVKADFVMLPNNTDVRRWLHMFENRVPVTCIVTNRFRAEDGGDMAAENLVTMIRGISTWSIVRIMVFCTRTNPLEHLRTLITKVSSDLKEVIAFINEHAASAGSGLTTTFRLVSDPRELDARIRQVETYVRVVKKLLSELKTDLDEHETLQDLRRRGLASKASMIRWLTLNGGHPDAPRVEATVASLEEAESMYIASMCDKSGLRNGALYFRIRENKSLIFGLESAHLVLSTPNKTRKMMLLVDKKRWAVWTKDGKEQLGSQLYDGTIEIRIGKSEFAIIWRHADGKSYGMCFTAKDTELPIIASELWRRVRVFRVAMNYRCVSPAIEVMGKENQKVILNLSVDNSLRIMPPTTGGSGRGLVTPAMVDLSPGVVVTEPMPGEQMKSFVSALSPSITRNRFEIRRSNVPPRVFEVESELEARVWIAVLWTVTGQALSAKQEPITSVNDSVIARSKSPTPGSRIGSPGPVPTPVAAASPRERALSLPSGGVTPPGTPPQQHQKVAPEQPKKSERALSPPRRAMAALQALPMAVMMRGKSPAPSSIPISAPTPAWPVDEAPALSYERNTPPIPTRIDSPAPTPMLPVSILPQARAKGSPLRQERTGSGIQQPLSSQYVRSSTPTPSPTVVVEKRKVFGDAIVSLFTTTLAGMQAVHERLAPGEFRSALLKVILDLEELQFNLSPKINELPAFLQIIVAQLEKPIWSEALVQYFTVRCPPSFVQTESEEYLWPFRLFSKLQDIIKTDLENSQELRMRKQLLLNQVVELLKTVNSRLPYAVGTPLSCHPSERVMRQTPGGPTPSPTMTLAPVPAPMPFATPASALAVVPAPAVALARVPTKQQLPQPQQFMMQVQRAQATWDYIGEGESEVSMKRGEILILKARTSAEWWFVENANGMDGYVPANHLKLLP